MDEETSPFAEAFRERYVDFGDIDVGKSSWEDITKAYGVSHNLEDPEGNLINKILDRGRDARTARKNDPENDEDRLVPTAINGEELFHIDDINDITGAMGLNASAQNDALQGILDNGQALYTIIEGIAGNTEVLSTASGEWQTWYQENG